MAHFQSTIIVHFQNVCQALHNVFFCCWHKSLFWIGLLLSFCWFAHSLRALIKFTHTHVAASHALWTPLPDWHCHLCTHSPLMFFSTNYARPTAVLLPGWNPPRVVFVKTVAIRAQIRNRNISLSFDWRDDSPQEIFNFQHNSLNYVQSSILIFGLFFKGLSYPFESPLRRACFDLENAFWFRTTFYLFQIFFGGRLLPLALYPFLLFFFGILHKCFLRFLFQAKSAPTFLKLIAPAFSMVLSRCVFFSTTAFHYQFFNGVRPCAVKMWLLHCWYKLTVRTSTPSSITIEANFESLKACHWSDCHSKIWAFVGCWSRLARNFFLLLHAHTPAFLQIPPWSLFFPDFESPHPHHQVPSHLPSEVCPCQPVSAFTFRIHDTPSIPFHGTVPSGFSVSPSDSNLPPLFLFLLSLRSTKLQRGLLLVLHLPRELRTGFFRITCHGRRARLNGHHVSSVIPMFDRTRSSQFS